MAPTKEEFQNFLNNSEEYKAYVNSSISIQPAAMTLAREMSALGCNSEQIDFVINSVNREIGKGIDTFVKKAGLGKSKGFDKKVYSGKEKQAREELSKKANYNYTKAVFDETFALHIDQCATPENGLTADDIKQIKRTRDFPGIVLKSGSDEKTQKENIATIRHMLGKDIDPKSYETPEQFKELQQKQFFEVINKCMEETANIDFSKYENLSDDKLVENWQELEKAYHMVSIIKAEFKDEKSPYFNQHLYDKVLDIEASRFGIEYNYDCSRMRAMASPYYSQYNISVLDGLKIEEMTNVTGQVSAEKDLSESRFMGEIDSAREARQSLLWEDVSKELNADNEQPIVPKYFDKNGKQIEDTDLLSCAAIDGVFFAAVDGEPKKTKAYTYDKINGIMQSANQKEYEKQIAEINKNIPDNIEKEKAAQKKADDELLKQNNNLQRSIIGGTSFLETVSGIVDKNRKLSQKPNAKSFEELNAQSLEILKKGRVSKNPKFSQKKFSQILGFKNSETPSQKEVEKRHQLSLKMADAMMKNGIDYDKGESKLDQLSKVSRGALNDRRLRAILCTPGAEHAQENLERMATFLDVDVNGQPKNTPPEKLNEIRNNIISEKLNRYEEITNKFNGKTLSDEDIVANWPDVMEVGLAMGMEWKNFTQDIVAAGGTLDKKLVEKANKIDKVSDAIHASFKGQGTYISSQYYQYGCEKAFNDNEKTLTSLVTTGDPHLAELGITMNAVKMNQWRVSAQRMLEDNKLQKENIEFAIDANGKAYTATAENIGKAIASGPAMVFVKGEKDPVVFTAGDWRNVPPKATKNELTPQLKAEVKSARTVGEMHVIEKSKETKQRKDLEESLLQSRFELSIIEQAYRNAPEAKKAEYKADLERHFSEYMAKLSIKKSDERKPLTKAEMDKALSKKEIQRGGREMRKQGAVKELFEDILRSEEGFANLEDADISEKLTEKFVKNENKQKEINAERREKNANRTANQKIDAIKQIGAPVTKDFWGYTREDVADISPNKFGLNVSRQSINSIAFGLLLNEGKGVEEVMADTPEALNMRKEASAKAIGLVTDGKGEEIMNALYGGMKKSNAYMIDKFKQLDNIGLDELTWPENMALSQMGVMCKDIFQESNIMAKSLPEDKQPKKEEFEYQKTVNNSYNSIISCITGGSRELVKDITKEKENFDLCHNITGGTTLDAAVKAAIETKVAQQLKDDPYNRGTDYITANDFKINAAYAFGNMTIQEDKNMRQLRDRAAKDPQFSAKIAASIIDGSFTEMMGITVDLKQNDPEAMPAVKADIKGLIEKLDNLELTKDGIVDVKQAERKLSERQAKELAEKVINNQAGEKEKQATGPSV